MEDNIKRSKMLYLRHKYIKEIEEFAKNTDSNFSKIIEVLWEDVREELMEQGAIKGN